MRKNIIVIISILLTALAFSSCETYSDDYDIEYTAIHPLGGQYMVTVTNTSDGTTYTNQYCMVGNTTNNDKNLCWVRIGALTTNLVYSINGKLSCDVSSLTFWGIDIENLAGNVVSSSDSFTITDGKVILEGVTAPSGTITDAISFTYTTSRNPGVTYSVEGYRYTGWSED